MIKSFVIWLVLSLSLSPTIAQALTATVDRQTVGEGETLQLILHTEGDVQNSNPDLSPLKESFEVLGTAKSTQISIINNNNTAQTQWIITLLPKKIGKLIIPALQLGQAQSQVISVEITAAAVASGKASQEIFLEAELTPKDPYVQSQATYIVKLFYITPPTNSSLTDPESASITVTRLGNDVGYHAIRFGQRYGVVERRYAIFPQNSGTITIKPPIFAGRLANSDADPYGLEQFFNNSGKVVRLSAPALQMQVRAKPNQISDQTWLPAQQLTLSDSWSIAAKELAMGEPITRTITLEATGANPLQLPETTQTTTAQFKAYPDKPHNSTYIRDNGLVTKRTTKIAYIPTQSGSLTIPAVQIPWWNTQSHRAEVATLPARTFVIKATATNIPAVTPRQANISANTTTVATRFNYWPWLAGTLFVLWILTLFKNKYHKPKTTEGSKVISTKTALRTLKKSCMNHQANQAKQNLLIWAAAHWSDRKVLSLGELAAYFTQDDLKRAIYQLDKLLYTEQADDWDGQAFWHIFISQVNATTPITTKSQSGALPELYLEE